MLIVTGLPSWTRVAVERCRRSPARDRRHAHVTPVNDTRPTLTLSLLPVSAARPASSSANAGDANETGARVSGTPVACMRPAIGSLHAGLMLWTGVFVS